MKNDEYSQARGGWSRILDISCEKCGSHICFYQKDGPGPLKRMYFDRILNLSVSSDELVCPKCLQVVGVKTTYIKEDRPAYRLFQSSVTKKITAQSKIS